MDAHAILTALRAAGLPVVGLHVPDPTDVRTWRFDGPLSDAERDRAVAIVAGQRAVPAASSFWPASPTQLELDVAAIKETLHLR